MRSRFTGFLLILFLLIPAQSFSVEVDWTHLDRAGYPWPERKAWDMIEFNGHYYVGGMGSQDDGLQRIWRTQDFQTWENITLTQEVFIDRIERLLEHNGVLYAFAVQMRDGALGRFLKIYRSNDGLTWTPIDSPFDEVQTEWDDVISFKGHLYAHAKFELKTYRVQEGGVSQWQELPAGQIRGADIAFTIFEDFLYMAQADIFESIYVEIWNSEDGTSWVKKYDNVIRYRRHIDKFSFATYEGDLYFAYENLYKLTINTWRADDQKHFFGNYLIFTVHGDLYAQLGPNGENFQGATFRWDPEKIPEAGWTTVIGSQFQCFDLDYVPIVSQDDKDYTLLCDIWSSKIGAYNLTPDNIDFINLNAQQTNVAALKWVVGFYLEESINQIRLVNKGTAEQGFEIERLKLFRENLGNGSRGVESYLGDFVLESAGNNPPSNLKSWVFNPDQTLVLQTNDLLIVRVDFAGESARFGKTIQLSVPADGFQWTKNETFFSPEITSTLESPITIFGVQGINLTGYNANPLAPGQTNRTVLAWVIDFLANESITKIKVKNFGTALSGVDIDRLTLLRSDDRLVGIEAQEVVTDLVPDPADKTMWSTPESFDMALNENHRYLLTVDVSPSARATSIQLGIPKNGIEWATNQGFDLNTDLVTNTIQRIVIPPPAPPVPIAEVIPFPNPARDEVKFTFDLDSQSDVVINIFNSLGQLVSEIKESKGQGFGAVVPWDARGQAPGMYLAVIKITSNSGQNRLFKRKVFIKR